MTEQTFIPLALNTLIPGVAETPFRRDELAQTSYRPTIVIGIGGTGLAVVRRLKKLLRRYYRRDEMDIFQFIVFDTAAQEVPEGEEPLDAGEFVYLGAFDAADLIRHLHENPYIARWWPGGPDRPYRPAFSGTGANRVRAIGRLVLYNYLSSTIIPRLESKIDRAIEINAQHGMGATSTKFYIIYSLPGGTGSGMGLDLAYVARMLGLRRQPTAYMTGILVMDDAFLPKAHTEYTRAEFRANTLAALKEINHFSAVRRFQEVYDDITTTAELPDGFRPFDITYLMGLHNAEGQALESFESLADMIAAEVMLEIASPLHGRTENVLDNVRANERSIAGQPAAFSSFALSALVFPLQGIASWCALAGFSDFTRRVLLSPRQSASNLETEVLAFTQMTGIEAEQTGVIFHRLNMDAGGQGMAAPSLNPDQITGLPDLEMAGALQRMEEGAQSDLARARERMMENVHPIGRQFRQDLQQKADALLSDPRYGVQYLVWFLSKLEDRLSGQRDGYLTGEQALYRGEVDRHEAAWRAASETISQVLRFPHWLPWRGWRLNLVCMGYTTAFNAYLNAAFQLESYSQAVVCFNQWIEFVRDLRRQAEQMVNAWQNLCEVTQERSQANVTQARATETEYSLMRNIVGQAELRQIFQQYAPDLNDEAVCNHLAGGFWQFFYQRTRTWRFGPNGETNEDLTPPIQTYYFLADWYASALRNQGLIERLQDLFRQNWQREIELRYRQTAPFWNYNLSRFGDKIRNNLQNEPRLVGYGEDNAAAWSNLVSRAIGETVDGVNNKNPHEMIFLNTAHGLPLFALRSINQTLRTAYQYINKLWEDAENGGNPIPVHISSLWEKMLPEIDPQPASVLLEMKAVPPNGRVDQPEEMETHNA